MSINSNYNAGLSVIARPGGKGCTDPISPIGPKGGGFGNPIDVFTPSTALSTERGDSAPPKPREGGEPEPQMGVASWWDRQVGKATRFMLRMAGIRYNVTSGQEIEV